MDVLTQLAEAVVKDLATGKDQLGLPFEVERSYAPEWDPAKHTEAENSKARVYVAAIAEEGEDASRGSYTRRAIVQIVVGAWVSTSLDHCDQLVALAGAIAARYREHANRTLTYDSTEKATIINIDRPAVYDVEQLRTNGAFLGAINLTIRVDEET